MSLGGKYLLQGFGFIQDEVTDVLQKWGILSESEMMEQGWLLEQVDAVKDGLKQIFQGADINPDLFISDEWVCLSFMTVFDKNILDEDETELHLVDASMMKTFFKKYKACLLANELEYVPLPLYMIHTSYPAELLQ